MKSSILLATTVALLTYPSVCTSSYLVQLTNGRQFVVHKYSDEGSKIRFYTHGGAIGIFKDSIKKIQESNLNPELQIDRRNTRAIILSPKAPSPLHKRDGIGEETVAVKKHVYETISFKYYKEEKLRLKAELGETFERFRLSSSNKSSEAKTKAIKDMTEVSRQILRLANELKKKNKGVLPAWWEGL